MYNFTYENQGNSSYLVYTLAEEEMTDSMSLGMITNNKIPGLASAMFMQMNSVRYMKYNISSKIPVSRFFFGPGQQKKTAGGIFGDNGCNAVGRGIYAGYTEYYSGSRLYFCGYSFLRDRAYLPSRGQQRKRKNGFESVF